MRNILFFNLIPALKNSPRLIYVIYSCFNIFKNTLKMYNLRQKYKCNNRLNKNMEKKLKRKKSKKSINFDISTKIRH